MPGAKPYVENLDKVKFASEENIMQLKRALQELRDLVRKFNSEFEENFKS